MGANALHVWSRTGRHAVPMAQLLNLLTREEAAKALRQSVRQTDKLIASGDLAVVRIGRSVRIRPSAVELFIEARESRGSRKKKGGAR